MLVSQRLLHFKFRPMDGSTPGHAARNYRNLSSRLMDGPSITLPKTPGTTTKTSTSHINQCGNLTKTFSFVPINLAGEGLYLCIFCFCWFIISTFQLPRCWRYWVFPTPCHPVERYQDDSLEVSMALKSCSWSWKTGRSHHVTRVLPGKQTCPRPQSMYFQMSFLWKWFQKLEDMRMFSGV